MIFFSGINFSISLTNPEFTFSYIKSILDFILPFLALYSSLSVLIKLLLAERSKHSILLIKNKVLVSQKNALYKKALICSIEVSSLQINNVLIIGIFFVKLR